MPKKYAKQKETPELFAKVFKVINGLKDKRNYITVHRIAKEIHAKLEQMNLKPDSRNVLIQVRRALKFGVRKKMFLYKAGKYRIAIEDSKSNSPKKVVVPLDSLEVLNSRKSQRRSRKSDVKKHRCTRQAHTSSCRKRYKKRDVRHNRRYLSRKCKSRYLLDSTTDKSSKVSSNSSTSPQLGVNPDETRNAENKSESEDFQKSRSLPVSSDIIHWDNKQEAIDKSKYGRQSRKSRVNLSPYHRSLSSSEGSKSRKNKKRKMKNLKEIENLSPDNANNNLSASTAIAAAIMIMMSLWYGCR